MKRLIKSALAVLAITLAWAGPTALADEIVLGISATPGSLQYLTAEEFIRRANAKFAGAHEVKFFHSSQLGKDKELLQKLKLGTVHLSMPSSIMSSVAPEFGLFDMPFMVKDRAHLNRVEHAIFWPTIAPKAEDKGYKIVGFWENGVRQITNNVRPINTPADLDGVKLRTPRGVWRIKMFEAWGASPTPMAFSEVFVALQTNVIDGQENPLVNINSAKFQEVQKYLSMTGHVYTPSYLTTGLDTWNNWPEDVRAVMADTAREVQVWMYVKGMQLEEDLLKSLQEGGMEVNVADRAAFVEASQPIYKAFAEEVEGAQAMIDQTLELAD